MKQRFRAHDGLFDQKRGDDLGLTLSSKPPVAAEMSVAPSVPSVGLFWTKASSASFLFQERGRCFRCSLFRAGRLASLSLSRFFSCYGSAVSLDDVSTCMTRQC